MKIAIIGSHGLGKTTLCYEVMAKLKLEGIHAGMLTEAARNCPFEVNENATPNSQSWILHTQIVKEIEEKKKYNILVCDRSVLDNYMYTIHLFGRDESIEPMIRNHMKSYDFLVWIPLWKAPPADGFRSTDRRFQLDIHELFRLYIPFFEVDLIPLCRDCRDSWSATVVEEIKKRLNDVNRLLRQQ